MVEAISVSIDPGSLPPDLLISPLRGVAAGGAERGAGDAFLIALESGSEDGDDASGAMGAGGSDSNMQQKQHIITADGGGGGRQSRKARVAALREGGVWRGKVGHGAHGIQRVADARHASRVCEQRQMVRAVAGREGFGAPLALRLVLLRRLAAIRVTLKRFPAVAACHSRRRSRWVFRVLRLLLFQMQSSMRTQNSLCRLF